jgi:hypothetical protein
VRNEIETKGNETKSTKAKRNETKRNEINKNETKRNQRGENEIKRNQRKQNKIRCLDYFPHMSQCLKPDSFFRNHIDLYDIAI